MSPADYTFHKDFHRTLKFNGDENLIKTTTVHAECSRIQKQEIW